MGSQCSSTATALKEGFHQQTEEISHGCHNLQLEISEAFYSVPEKATSMVKNIHVPYFPLIMGPFPWLLNYVRPPYNKAKFDMFIADFSAGLTIGLTLVPQGLAYASLANLPPVNGLYAAVLQPALYVLFGTSNCLAVGPVAIVSLLVATLVNQYGITPGSNESVDLASQLCLGMGIILVLMGILNLGSFIRFLSHPVISGFTSAAAMLIGLSQVKSAFNFSGVPQVGDTSAKGVEYQYQQMQWYIKNWNGQYAVKGYSVKTINQVNQYAVALCFGVYVPLIIINQIKQNLKFTAEQKKTIAYQCWQFFTCILPLLAIIIAGNVTYKIQTNNPTDPYAQTLKIVGTIKPGLGIIRMPSNKYPLTTLLADVFPLTLIGFMESYSVARKIATSRNELHILNASQELFAIGAANLVGCFSSGYPICGSYSRSSLAYVSGAQTPFCAVVTLIIIVIALGSLTGSFFYIPQSALAGIIFVAVTNIIAPSEFVEAWIHNRNDFLTMLITFIITLVFDTALGLAAGIGVSVFMLLKDIVFSPDSKPFYEILPNMNTLDGNDDLEAAAAAGEKNSDSNDPPEGDGRVPNKDLTVQIVRLNNDLVFLTAPAIKDTLVDELLNKRGHKFEALILDFSDVKIVDISGMIALKETMTHTRGKAIKFVLMHVRKSIFSKLEKFGITSDLIVRQRIDVKSTGGLYNTIARPSEANFFSGITDEEVALLASLDPRDENDGSFNGMVLESDERIHIDAGILKSSTFSIHQYDNMRSASRDSTNKREWLDVTPTQALPHNGDVTRDAHRDSIRLEKNPSMSNGLRSRSRDSDRDYHDLIPPRVGEESTSTHTPSTHSGSQRVAGI